MNAPQYEQRVKDEIKKGNTKKLDDLNSEIMKIEETIKRFKEFK